MDFRQTPDFVTADRLTAFVARKTPLYPGLATHYWALSQRYGVRADWALFHALYMTSWLRNDRAKANDFGFLGQKFSTMAAGVTAHLQYLASLKQWQVLPPSQLAGVSAIADEFALFVAATPEKPPKKPVAAPEPARSVVSHPKPILVPRIEIPPVSEPVSVPVVTPTPVRTPTPSRKLPWYIRPFVGKAISFGVGLLVGAVPVLAPHKGAVEAAVKAILDSMGVM